jgi:hypothetical protein
MHAVLLARPEQLQYDAVARFLAAYRGVPLFDARIAAKHSWGFLGEKLTEEEARRLADAASAQGLEAAVVPEAKAGPLPDPLPVHELRCSPEALAYTVGTSPEERRAPWDSVAVASAVGLREEFRSQKTVQEGPSQGQRLASLGITLATGIPIHIGGKKKEVVKNVVKADFFLYMDVFLRVGPAYSRLHVDAQKFRFTYLGERRQPAVLGNFRLVLEDLARYAPGARLNKGVRTSLAGQPFLAAGYDSMADYEKECRWLLALASA